MIKKAFTNKYKKNIFNYQDYFLFHGDCNNLIDNLEDDSIDLIISSPPYCMRKAYEDVKDDIKTFQDYHRKIFPKLLKKLKVGGSLCWQIGYHVNKFLVMPLDIIIYNLIEDFNCEMEEQDRLYLRNRIIWIFGHGLHSEHRFSGRHETILWFTKGKKYHFDLDSVRIPQKYPGKTYFKGDKKGEFSGNPKGKNPSDVWDIPNVKANHVEKTEHPCQFPVALVQRLIKSLTNENDVVLDPFSGVGSTAIACGLEKRKFYGAELDKKYYDIAIERINETIKGIIKYREDVPVLEPNEKMKVAKKPENFK